MGGRLGLLAVAAALVAAACGGGAGGGVPDVASAPPGSAMMEGLRVPEGSRLVGPVFARPAPEVVGAPPGARATVALLEVDGDPFAAWDDLARQARALGAPLPSSGVCAWYDVGDHEGSVRQPQPAAAGRPPGEVALSCEASAQGPTGGGELMSVTARLWRGSAGSELGLEVVAGDVLGVGSTAVKAGDPGAVRAFPEGDDPPVPARARADVRPLPAGRHTAGPGERFGAKINCFESGYRRLRVPAGARLVGGAGTPALDSFGAVLAVRDARAALRALAGQLDPTGPAEGEGTATVRRAVAGGHPVWRLSASVGTGGGSCEMWSSPDGHAVMVIAHND